MTAKEYLKQIRALDIKIKQRRDERDLLRSQAEGNRSPDMNPNKVQTSISGDPMGDKLAAAADIDREIEWLTNRLITDRHRIINEIQSLQNPKYVEILYLHYVKYKRLEEVSCIMKKTNGEPYSYDHIASLHGLALQEFDRIILKSPSNPK